MIVFSNPGLIDLRAMTVMGVSAKESDNPIGMFGTGFKFAAAVLLRNGCSVTVYRGLEKFTLSSNRIHVRNENFDLVTLNEVELGFTTQLGKTWQLWQAFRELYCNALDEGGAADQITGPVLSIAEGHTTIVIDGPGLDEVWKERNTIVLQSTPVHIFPGLELHSNPGQYLFYRGVRVAQLDNSSSYTYNLTGTQQLTEDRTLVYGPYSQAYFVADILAEYAPEALLSELLLAGNKTWEHNHNYCNAYSASQTFLATVRSLAKTRGVNDSAVRAMYRQTRTTPEYKAVELGSFEKRDLKEAVKLCAALGYDVTEFPVTVSDELDEQCLGLARMDTKQIVLSRRVFKMGLRMVAGTLLEEHIHLKFGLMDTSRELQNHLLDTLMECAAKLRSKRTRKAA